MAMAGLPRSGHVGGTLLDRNVEKILSEPWGAAKAGVHYNKETLGSLCDQFARLEPQARRGALQGTLFMRQSQRVSLSEDIRVLVDLAVDDKDQWVSLIARALGGLKERFDLRQLQQDMPAVRSSTSRQSLVSGLSRANPNSDRAMPRHLFSRTRTTNGRLMSSSPPYSRRLRTLSRPSEARFRQRARRTPSDRSR